MSRWIVALFIPLFFAACSSTDRIDENTAEGAFTLGERYEKDERFEEALVQYNQVKNKHPYSRFAVEAKLRIADIHFKREDWVEAQNAYQLFKELHPKHPKSDYVTYQLALCYFNQLPSTIDRDLTLADKAIMYFDETLQSFAGSEYAKPAKEYKEKALKMLAEKVDYIGNFYFIREKFDSALLRYEELLEKYPGLGLDAKGLYRAAVSAYKTEDLAKARGYYRKLMASFPNSEEARNMSNELIHALQ